MLEPLPSNANMEFSSHFISSNIFGVRSTGKKKIGVEDRSILVVYFSLAFLRCQGHFMQSENVQS